MKKSRFTETQIAKAIKEHESGRKAEELCWELGISSVTFSKWNQKYGGMKPVMLIASRNWKRRTQSSNGCMPT